MTTFLEVTSGKQKWQMHSNLLAALNVFKKNIKHGWDFVCLVTSDGMPRVGKTVLALQSCQYLDKTFNIDRVCFTGEELREKSMKLSEGQAIVLDEARTDLGSQSAIETHSKKLLRYLDFVGKKHLFFFILMPDFFQFNSSLACGRSICLFNLKFEANIRTAELVHGKFNYFSYHKKRRLYYMGKQMYRDYNAVRPDFIGFTKDYWPINKAEYEARKDKATKELIKKEEEAEQKGNNGNKRDALKEYARSMAIGLARLRYEEGYTVIKLSRMFERKPQNLGALISLAKNGVKKNNG